MAKRRLLALAGMPFVIGGALGHAFQAEKVGDHYGWVPSPWFQRQLASFELPHLYALLLLIRGRGRIDDLVYMRMLATTSLLLGANHCWAISKGDAAGANNIVMAIATTALGLAGMVLAQHEATKGPSTARSALTGEGQIG
jgi:hypothetical protein